MRTSLRAAIALLLLASVPLRAQFGESSRQSPSSVPLSVRVVYGDDRAVPLRVTVEVLASGGVAVETGVTNDDGALHFTAIPPGDYQLEVYGPGIQKTRSATFTLYREEHFHMETVTVRPENSSNAEETAGAPGTISAASLNIPEGAKDDFRKGAEALKSNNLTEARKQFEEAVKQYPKYSAAYDGLGIALARMGNNSEALADLHKSVELDGHNVQACLNLARLAYRSGKAHDAEEALNTAIGDDPKNVEALGMLSDLQLRTGRYKEAATTERKIHALPHSGFESAHLIAGAAYQAQHLWSQAAGEYELYLKEQPNGPRAEIARKQLTKVQMLARNGS